MKRVVLFHFHVSNHLLQIARKTYQKTYYTLHAMQQQNIIPWPGPGPFCINTSGKYAKNSYKTCIQLILIFVPYLCTVPINDAGDVKHGLNLVVHFIFFASDEYIKQAFNFSLGIRKENGVKLVFIMEEGVHVHTISITHLTEAHVNCLEYNKKMKIWSVGCQFSLSLSLLHIKCNKVK